MQPLLLETIKIEDGQIKNILWHNRRCNKSRFELFNEKEVLNLENYIEPPKDGLYRCRIIYSTKIESVEYIPYTPRVIKSFKIIESQINYNYKYNNRDKLNQLIHPEYDEIIIEKDGFLTDTTIANIAFYTGEDWITPKNPLLSGTIRAKLLDKSFLIQKNIKKEELQNFSHFALMNAMIGFQIQKSTNIQL